MSDRASCYTLLPAAQPQALKQVVKIFWTKCQCLELKRMKCQAGLTGRSRSVRWGLSCSGRAPWGCLRTHPLPGRWRRVEPCASRKTPRRFSKKRGSTKDIKRIPKRHKDDCHLFPPLPDRQEGCTVCCWECKDTRLKRKWGIPLMKAILREWRGQAQT